MARISTYPIISVPTFNDLLIGTDVENLNETKNFAIGDIADLIIVGSYVPYIGATQNVDLGIHSITASSFIVPGGLSTEFVKADGSLDSTVYQPAGNYITGLSGEATASGPGVANVVLSNGAVIGKVLTGLTITGGSVSSSDTILQAFGKLQNQVNGLYGGAIYQGTWDALTNTPTLTSSVGTQGYYYIVSVAGSTNLNGISDWNVGDWAIFDGTAWQQVDNTDTVVSVNGQVGIVVLTTTNIAEGTNLYYTDVRAREAISLTTTGSSGAATYSDITGILNVPNYTLSGLGGVPSTRQLTINGTAYDLSADRSWSVGTVTSIGTSGPLTGGTITGSGTIGITQSGIASDGYLSSVDWNTFNNKQNALTNPVTGTGTVYYIPMWTGTTFLGDSVISQGNNIVNFNFDTPTGSTINYINTNGVDYTYTIQMNNVGTRQTYHSYTDGNILQQINGNVVSRNLQSGQLALPYYTATGSFLGTSVGYLGFDASGNILTVSALSSVGLSMPSAFTVSNSPLTSNGTIAVTGAGLASQYVRGDGTLADFPSGGGGGGASVAYYLNGSINQGTFGGNVYYQMDKVPIIGAGTDFSRATNGYIAQFITDVGVPNALLIPGGNWNLEFYFSASSGGGTPSFYVELYKYNGTTFTLISSNSATPETITGGTSIDAYFTPLAVPETVLAETDRLAIRIYVTTIGRTITLHTENSHLCEIITTFTTGLTALNGLTKQVQYFAVGTSGTDFNISSSVDTHTFNLPTASAVNRGALSSADWSVFNAKVGGTGASGQVAYWNGTNSQTGSANLIFDGTRLGVGRTPAARKLEIEQALGGVAAVMGLYAGGGTLNSVIGIDNEPTKSLQIATTGNLIFYSGSTIGNIVTTPTNERIRLFTSGNLAIGSTTDNGNRLQVQGTGYFSGNVGIGSTGLTNINFRIEKNITGNTVAFNIGAFGTVLSDVTNQVRYVATSVNTQAASFTLGNAFHFYAEQGTIGVGSSITNQYGYFVNNTLIGATNNFGFYGNIAAGTNRWNLYMDGTADNYLRGKLLINTTTVGTFSLDVNGTARVSGDALINGVTIGEGGSSVASNTALGASALLANTTGFNNTAVGNISQRFNTTASNNTSVGSQSLYSNTTGSNNIAIGLSALYNNGGGAENVAVGLQALFSNVSGVTNTAIGSGALYTNTTSYNTSIGFQSSYLTSTGGNNTALGYQAMYTNANGSQNVSIGLQSNFSNTSGSANTSIGHKSGYGTGTNANTTGGNNIFIGDGSVGESATESNRTWIGNTSTQSTWVGGNLLVGTRTNATYKLDVNGTARVTGGTNADLFIVRAGTTGQSIVNIDTSTYSGDRVPFSVKGHASQAYNFLQIGKSGADDIFNINSSGNLGLGVTPSAWTNCKAIDISTIGSVFADGFSQNNQAGFATNAYRAGAAVWYYKGTAAATYYAQDLGTHKWFSAASGTAGAAISFTQAMTLTGSNNLLVGTTTDTGYRVQITGTGDNMLNVWGATAPSIRLDNAASAATQRFVIGLATGTNQFIQGAVAGNVCITTATSSPMVFGMWQTSTSEEVMRITTSKNLLINKTADGGQKLQVSGAINFASLPTSSAGLSSGDIWNNGGVLNIV